MNTEKCKFYFYFHFVGNWLDLWKRVTKYNGLVERGCSACYLLQCITCINTCTSISNVCQKEVVNIVSLYYWWNKCD